MFNALPGTQDSLEVMTERDREEMLEERDSLEVMTERGREDIMEERGWNRLDFAF